MVAKLSNTKIVSATTNNEIKVWELPFGNCIQTFSGTHFVMSKETVLKLSEKTIAIVSYKKTIEIWDLTSETLIQTLSDILIMLNV